MKQFKCDDCGTVVEYAESIPQDDDLTVLYDIEGEHVGIVDSVLGGTYCNLHQER